MHIHNLDKWTHSHRFAKPNRQGERNTRWVVILTLMTMVAEIAAGILYGSMALLADGWHMGTHAAALGIAVFAYGYARRHADNPRFTFGTGKIGVLGGYTSAVGLAIAALLMGAESIRRLIDPSPIRFNEAILVAILGLAVNLFSAWLLHGRDGGHGHDDEDHAPGGHHHDHNLRAAYLHVIADALTSLLAIVALSTGKLFGWVQMDPLMGVVGAVVIFRWSWGLLRESSRILLDHDAGSKKTQAILQAIERDSDNRVTDHHVWRISEDSLAVVLSVVTHYPKPPDHYKHLLSQITHLRHITVEVIPCESDPCLAQSKPEK
ncbi:MAG: CDF family Co(II)/Ni(II) efflux transporter DmeF [Desulfobacterales bacterium]|jgi:cation diffusion facilitator family transporter